MRNAQVCAGAVVGLLLVLVCGAGPAAAQQISGRAFTTYIYSDLLAEPSTTVTFETNGTMLISEFNGFGLYATAGGLFAGFFSAPNYSGTDDLVLLMSGAVVGDLLGGAGVALENGGVYGGFAFFGYAQ